MAALELNNFTPTQDYHPATKKYVDDEIAAASSPFTVASNLVRNTGGDVTQDDFLFGSTQFNDTGNVNHDNRFFFDKSSGAFRCGGTIGTEWDTRGNHSFCANADNKATGVRASALGYKTIASGPNALSGGYNLENSGGSGFATGNAWKETKNYAISVGYGSGPTNTTPAGLARLHADIDQNNGKKAGLELSSHSTGATNNTGVLENISGRAHFAGNKLALDVFDDSFCGNNPTPTTLGSTQVLKFSTTYTSFGQNSFDANDNYDETTGIYTAPADGTYEFAGHILFNATGSSIPYFRVLVGTNVIIQVHALAGQKSIHISPRMFELDEDDEVKLQSHSGDSSWTVNAGSYFSVKRLK